MRKKKRLFHTMDRFTKGSELYNLLTKMYDDLTNKAIICERMCRLIREAFNFKEGYRWHGMSPDRITETAMVGLLRGDDMRAFRMLNAVNMITKSVKGNDDTLILRMTGGNVIGSIKLLFTPNDNYLYVVYDMQEGYLNQEPFRAMYTAHLDDVLHVKLPAFSSVRD